MPRPKPELEEPFYERLAKFMAQEDKEIFVAATSLELGLTSAEVLRVSKNRAFQRCLRIERIRVYNELADDPNRGKTTLVGQAIYAIEKLMDADQYDKALTGILSLAKIEGFVGSDSTVNVFASLNTKDMEALREKLKAKQEGVPQLPKGTA